MHSHSHLHIYYILYIYICIFLQSLVPRHTLDISMKYSYVPQTEAPYKMDRYSPVDWSASEPEKVSQVMMMMMMMTT